MVHLYRTTPPQLLEEVCAQHDNLNRLFFQTFVVGKVLTDAQWNRAQLPFHLGGFNFIPAHVLSVCGWLASLIANESQILALRPSAGPWFVEQREKAAALYFSLFPASAKSFELKANTTQRDLVRALMEARWDVLFGEADTHVKALMRSQRQDHSWAWKTAPASPDLMFAGNEFQVAVRYSLRVPFFTESHPCPGGCGFVLDVFCDHARHCPKYGDLVNRHNAGVKLIANEFKAALINCTVEQRIDTSKSTSYTPDITSEPLPGLSSRAIAFDLTVINPLSDTMFEDAARKDLAAASEGEARKTRLHLDEMDRRGYDFIPLALEATGGHAPKIAEVMHNVLRQKHVLSGVPFPELTNRFWYSFAVSLQRANALMIIHRLNATLLPETD